MLNPIQERRRTYENNPRLAWDILEAGSARARAAADLTLTEVRDAMGMSLGYQTPVMVAE
jgi:tryptophanyl-tRNA synthetase